jgi:hypothetical protein
LPATRFVTLDPEKSWYPGPEEYDELAVLRTTPLILTEETYSQQNVVAVDGHNVDCAIELETLENKNANKISSFVPSVDVLFFIKKMLCKYY